MKLFNQGTEAYHDQKYSEVIKLFEASLKDLLNAEEDCRAYCEGPFDQGWLPDFVSSVASRYWPMANTVFQPQQQSHFV